MPVIWNAKQREARDLMMGPARHLLLAGGSRSGKSFLLCYQVAVRALKAPGSRHAILRHRFNACKTSIAMDTWPKMMSLAFPEVKYTVDRTDWFCEFPNGSEVWFGGLDDNERVEKILGREYLTIFLNEVSQISYASRNIARTRLAQRATDVEGDLVTPRMLYDCNPSNKVHWTYRLWVEGKDPDTRLPLRDPENYAWLRVNPVDNLENLSAEYLSELESQPPHIRKRFMDGEWMDATPGQLFDAEKIDQHRVIDGKLPAFLRVVVAVDPSGAGSSGDVSKDSIGIIVAALGLDGKVYILEDCTVLAGPSVWGRIATTAYDRWGANCVVAEKNFGGAMVRHVIQSARPNTPYKEVTASRGKSVRAEPVAALYEQGRVRHVGYYPELEDELTAFSTHGYMGDASPNRADALVWAVTEFFPAVVAEQSAPPPWQRAVVYHPTVRGMGY